MSEILRRIKNFYIQKKKIAVCVTAFAAVLLAAAGVYAMIPLVDAANESGTQGNPITLKANYSQEQTVEPNQWYRITGSTNQTYLLKYSGKGSGPAYIILDQADITLSTDIPAIKFIAEEDSTSSYQGSFEVYIKGENVIKSTCVEAKSPLIQIDSTKYTVQTYDVNSDQTDQAKRFREENVSRNNSVIFRGNGSADDVLRLVTAQDSYGAAIGSGELGTLGLNLKFKAGNGSQHYLGPELGYYKDGQQEFKPGSELKCGNGDIEIASGATVIIEGNGYGPGIGAGASIDSRIVYSAKNSFSTGSTSPATGSADASSVMSDGNITISGGSVYIHMATGALGSCIGTGAVAGTGYNQGTVLISGGNVDLQPGQKGFEFGKAVNAEGKGLHKYIFAIQEEADKNGGRLLNGSTYLLENKEGAEDEYYVQNEGADSGINDLMQLSVDINDTVQYRFTGYAKAYFESSSDESKKMYFWLPTEVLPASSFTVDGDLPNVQYEYKVGNGTYQNLAAGKAVEIKQTKNVEVKLSNVPEFCTSVSYTTSLGKSGSIERNDDGEYIFSFKMPEDNYSVTFSYEIGKYKVEYDYGPGDASAVENPNPSQYICGETLVLKDAAWENHIFAGWYTSPNFLDEEKVTETVSNTVDEVITLYAKWQCTVSFVDDEGNPIQDDIIVDVGTRFMESMYPADPEDTEEKAFEGWTLNGIDYEKGSYPEFVVSENIVITGRYLPVGYFVYVSASYTNEEEYTSPVDLRSMASFDMFFKEQPIEFVKTEAEGIIWYKTSGFADRSDVTTGKITAKTGFKITSVDVKNKDGEDLEIFSSMDDEHAFTFTMPATDVYITVNIKAPDYKISYHDGDGSVIIPVETEENPNVYEFNAKTEEILLNPAPQTDRYKKFAGWYVFGDPDKNLIGTIPTGAYEGDLILVAEWEEVVTYPVIVSEDSSSYIKVYDFEGNEVTKGIPGETLSITVNPGPGIRYESMTYTYTDEDGGVYTNKKTPSEDQKYPCTYTFKMPEYQVDVIGEFSLIEYTISYLNLHGAKNPNPLTYTVKSVISLQELEKKGNQFTGWTIVLPDIENGYESVKEEPISSIENMTGNLILVANWENEADYDILHKVTVNTDSDGNGSVTAYTDEAYKGQYVFVSVTPNRGYRLKGISYDDAQTETYSAVKALRAVEDLLSVKIDLPLFEVAEGVYYFLMPDKDITLTAEFEPIEYEITYIDGSVEDNPEHYTVESVISLTAPSRDGYEFLGWYNDEGTLVSEIRDSIGNLTLTAKWRDLSDNKQEDEPKEPETPAPGNPNNPDNDSSMNNNQTDDKDSSDKSVIDQILELIKDKSKVDSSEDTAAQGGGNKQNSGQQISTGDKANISHLVLLCTLSLIILIIACPKKKDESEKL